MAALLGVASAAALAMIVQSKKKGSDWIAASMGRTASGLMSLQIDDDQAAEIIRRARPALERAREANQAALG